ncbi:hypothetical protein ACFW2D_03290 [Streptomyces sp. NPDC058914]
MSEVQWTRLTAAGWRARRRASVRLSGCASALADIIVRDPWAT